MSGRGPTFRPTAVTLKKDFDARNMVLGMDLKDWLAKHIQGTDQQYGPHMNKGGH